YEYQPLPQDVKANAVRTETVTFHLNPASTAQTVLPLSPPNSQPMLIKRTEPEYSEQARKAKYQGTVVLFVTVGTDGIPKDVKVIRSLGLGLDENASAAVRQWRFRPATSNGQPVESSANIE